jgi:hypothetical protein
MSKLEQLYRSALFLSLTVLTRSLLTSPSDCPPKLRRGKSSMNTTGINY